MPNMVLYVHPATLWTLSLSSFPGAEYVDIRGAFTHVSSTCIKLMYPIIHAGGKDPFSDSPFRLAAALTCHTGVRQPAHSTHQSSSCHVFLYLDPSIGPHYQQLPPCRGIFCDIIPEHRLDMSSASSLFSRGISLLKVSRKWHFQNLPWPVDPHYKS